MTNINNKTLAIAATKNNNLKTNNSRRKTLLLALLFIGLAPIAARAQFGGGSGTQLDPYIISSANHMSQLATEVNSNGNKYNGVYFELDADLDFSGRLYAPIGNFNHSFAGFFDGNNHTIRNVSIGTANPTGTFVGLFGVVSDSCCIKNLKLASSSINGYSVVGGIAGCVFREGYALTDRGIRNCIVESDVTISGNNSVGGIIGITDGKVYHCINLSSSISGVNRVGAIAGYTYAMGYITDCYVIGNCPKGAIGQEGSSTGTDEGADVMRISTITFDTGFTLTNIYTSVALSIGSTKYYRCGRDIFVDLFVNREVPEGYYGKEFLIGDMVLEPVPNVPDRFTFILPMADNAHITIGEVKRDIAYTNWVEITITQQVYTGEALPPPITVTDIKDGTPVTLTEGTHYRLELPSGGCIYPGNYNIPVIGIGGFGNRVTVVFQIINPNFNFEGNGSEQTPYLIQNTDDMDAFGQLVNQGFHCQGLHFSLTADLDYSSKTYTPVGTADNPFCGTFDGNSYTISGVMIDNDNDYIGIFGHIENGTVKYLRFANSTIRGWHNVGGIVGQGKGSVESCYVAENVSIVGVCNVGGIAGRFDLGSVTQCENHANVMCVDSNAGGIVGCVEDNAQGVSIVDCFNSGNLSSFGSVFGGIVGKIGDYAVCTVEGCINEGEIYCYGYGGGIVGTIGFSFNYFDYLVTVKDNLNLGAVFSTNSSCGGIVAKIDFFVCVSNNYYAGACNLSLGIGNLDADELGIAMRGYTIEVQHPLGISLEGSIGLFYDGKVYAGENQEVIVGFEVAESSYVPQCLSFSAGTYNNNDDGTCTVIMPAENITVSDNIVEIDGLHYELSCDGSNTATVIQNDAYAYTLEDNFAVPYGFTLGETYYEVVAIGPNTFEGCTGITELYLYENMAVIGSEAFKNCTGLTKINSMPLVPPTAAEDAFSGVSTDIPVEVAFCSQYDYSVATGWSGFSNIQGGGPCEHTFMGMEDSLWSNPNNWMGGLPDANSTVGIHGECEIDVDVTVKSVTIGDYANDDDGVYDRLTVKNCATLTATDFIFTVGDATHFVIEDGAQVIHDNAGAVATVKKTIAGYGNSEGNYYLIASPIADSITPSEDNGLLTGNYDLYRCIPTSPDRKEWRNHEKESFDIHNGQGYLYANQADTLLRFGGALMPSGDNYSVTVYYQEGNNGPGNGWNLLGNPFPCSCFLVDDEGTPLTIYKINADGSGMVEVESGMVGPMEGFFFHTTTTRVVYFSRTAQTAAP